MTPVDVMTGGWQESEQQQQALCEVGKKQKYKYKYRYTKNLKSSQMHIDI